MVGKFYGFSNDAKLGLPVRAVNGDSAGRVGDYSRWRERIRLPFLSASVLFFLSGFLSGLGCGCRMFVLPAVTGDAFARCLFEKTAECGGILESEQRGDLLCTFGGVEQQPLGFGAGPFVDHPQRRGESVGGEEVGQRFRGAV